MQHAVNALDQKHEPEVDFIRELEPAMYFLWTIGYSALSSSESRQLADTTVDFLLMSKASTMIVVKGITGGQRAMLSSFSLSAAMFGTIRKLTQLSGSTGRCSYREAGVQVIR